MIRINKIEFHNYRQYKNVSIDFEKKNEYNLHILRAKNGTGKTTFLNGILWCLYAKEHYVSNSSKALMIVNESVVQDANEGDMIDVWIKLTISDNDKFLVFERNQKFNVIYDPLTELKKSVAICKPILRIIETPIFAFANAQVYESEEDTLRIVKQYFDEDIFSYYFFDGENLKNYFDEKNTEKVKNSIYSLSQVNLLSNSSRRTETLSVEKSRELVKKRGINYTIYDEIDRMQDEIERLENDNKNIDIDIPVLQKRLNELNAQLAGYKPIRDNQLRRNELERQLKNLQNEQSELFARKKEFIRTYYTLFNLFPRIKSTLDMIIYKEQHGELPPRIDKKQVEELLNNHEANCPMCDNELNDHAIEHLQKLLEELDVSSQTSNYLSSIKGGLENAVATCYKYPKERENIIKKEKYYSEEIEKIEKELKIISQYLSTYSDNSSGVIDVSKLEKERLEIQNEISIKQQRKGANDLSLKNDKEKLKNLQAQVEEMEKIDNEKILLQKQIRLLRQLTTSFEQVKKNLMDEIKVEIEASTWRAFKNMIWKKQTFHSLSINDDYQMTVYSNNLNDMTGSLSATESMALAYAFTLAIHETSGRNCPLVVDSPLGRVSDENRINMARELLKISKDKQIIMLFTPDEYSKEVAEVYDFSVASIRDISLTQDETEIGKVDK